MELKIKIFSLYLLNNTAQSKKPGETQLLKKRKREKDYMKLNQKIYRGYKLLEGSHDYHCSQPQKM